MTALSDLAAQAAMRLRQEQLRGAGAGDMTEARECPTHGAYEARGTYKSNIKRTVWTRCPACQREDEEAVEADRSRARAAAAAASLERALKISGMPKRFHGKHFAGYEASTPEQVAALTICREYADGMGSHVKTGASLILSGKPGTGKSHLAAAVMHAAMGSGLSVQYVTCMDLVRAVRATWRRDSERTEDDVLATFGDQIDLLVIDEVGVQYSTEGEQTIIFDVLDRRYREMRPAIIISNAGKAAFQGCVGDRVFDRLREVAQWVAFGWESHRPAARKQGE